MDARYDGGRTRRWFIGSALSFAATPYLSWPALAQPTTVDQMTDLAGRAIHRIILPGFRNSGALSSSENAIFSQITWDLQSWNMNLFDTRATMDGDRRVIIISAGMADLVYTLAYDWVLATGLGMDAQFGQYIPFVMQKIRDNQRLAVKDNAAKPVPRFMTYAHISSETIQQHFTSSYPFAEVGPLTVYGLAFICGHELGHHVNHDVGSGRTGDLSQREREARADRFSLSLCLRSGFNPIGALPLFGVFMASGDDPDHPPPECRLYDFMGPSMAKLQHDPRFAAYLRDNPDAARKLSAFPQWMSQLRSMLPASCH